MPDYSSALSKYLPPMAAPVISQWINDNACRFRVSRNRVSKFGDYRPPYGKHGHRISVNQNLNPYAFLITTVHEFAHLKTWNTHRNLVKPHGPEWKANFRLLMQPFLQAAVFPADILTALTAYMDNPAASSCADEHLFRRLREHDDPDNRFQTLDQLPDNALFSIQGGRVFQKKERLRKRYRCIEVKTLRAYLFQPIAEVRMLGGKEE